MLRLLLAACLVLAWAATLRAAERPNVILIISDDLNTQPLRDGSPVRVPTPNIDRLRAAGVSFGNAHAVSPICGPSRACFLTGYLPQTSGYWGWKQQRNDWRDNQLLRRAPTFIAQARDHGYRIAGGGKIFHNGHEDWNVFKQDGELRYGPRPSFGPYAVTAPKGPMWKRWTTHPAFPGMKPYDHYCPLSLVPVTDGHAGWGIERGTFRYEGPDQRDPMPDEELARWAAGWLNSEQDDQRPFLLCVGFNRPHQPFVVPDEYFDRLPLDAVQPVPTPPEDGFQTAPSLQPPEPDTWTRGGVRRYPKVLERDGDLRQWTRAYQACVSFVDDQIGVILAGLADSPHAENTVVILTSDHGYHMGEKKRLWKNTVWEPATAVPFLVAGPGVAAGAEVVHPVSLVDLYPTIQELCALPEQRGADLPPLDGTSLVPLLRDPDAAWDGPAVALSTVPPDDEPSADLAEAIPQQHWSVRDRRYRYVRASRGGVELYDLATDPWEHRNRADDPTLAEVRARLHRELEQRVGVSLAP
ncbi:MAG: sulfatase-like hydrolase/transferase [Planctomycetota bacterium]